MVCCFLMVSGKILPTAHHPPLFEIAGEGPGGCPDALAVIEGNRCNATALASINTVLFLAAGRRIGSASEAVDLGGFGGSVSLGKQHRG